ncbi:hypothetical protein [Georgenia faecalis]|uniref:hypothetical protein n=1 Tax=Georgenia faecalis TaxID=2483799 RepID=UPI000FD90431|nr:hypothetical protein [Georgenia faecalis]
MRTSPNLSVLAGAKRRAMAPPGRTRRTSSGVVAAMVERPSSPRKSWANALRNANYRAVHDGPVMELI